MVRAIENRQHALPDIALALVEHANALNTPLAIYIDISHRDVGWTDLIRELARHQNLKILVTIREEDWRRTTLSAAEIPHQELKS